MKIAGAEAVFLRFVLLRFGTCDVTQLSSSLNIQERIDRIGSRCEAIFGQFLEQLQDKAVERARHGGIVDRWSDRVFVELVIDECCRRVSRHRQRTSEHLVENDASRVEIGCGADTLAEDLLGRHVFDRAQYFVSSRQKRLMRNFGDAEIQDLYGALRLQEDVLRFDVAMNDVVFVGSSHRLEELMGDRQRFVDGHDTAAILLEQRAQRAPFDELHGEIEVAISLATAIHPDDVVVIEFGGKARLAKKAFGGTRFTVGRHDFESHVALEHFIPGSVDRPHSSTADDVRDAIVVEGVADQLVVGSHAFTR